MFEFYTYEPAQDGAEVARLQIATQNRRNSCEFRYGRNRLTIQPFQFVAQHRRVFVALFVNCRLDLGPQFRRSVHRR